MDSRKLPADSTLRDSQFARFISIGERLGDGDLDAPFKKELEREYKALMRVLVPETNAVIKKRRQRNAEMVNEVALKMIETSFCLCGARLKQSRFGSKVLNCTKCDLRYKIGTKKVKK